MSRRKASAEGSETWAHGRVVRQVDTGSARGCIGFLLHRKEAGQEPGWYVCLGWDNYLPGLATALPETAEFDRREGIRVDGELGYAWAGQPGRLCSLECPACTANGGAIAAFTCRLVPGLHGVVPGAHDCVIDADCARALLPKWRAHLDRTRAELSRAGSDVVRLELLVSALKRLAATDPQEE